MAQLSQKETIHNNAQHEFEGLTDEHVCTCVSKFLSKIQMSKYLPNFLDNGCETIAAVVTLSKDDLKEIGLKLGHKNLVYNAINDGTINEFTICKCKSIATDDTIEETKTDSDIVDIEWSQKKYGKFVTFINNNTVKLTKFNGNASMVLINQQITNKMCNKCNIHLKIYGNGDIIFAMGYVLSVNDIKSYDNGLGWEANANSTTGLYVYQSANCAHFYGKIGNVKLSNKLFSSNYSIVLKTGDIFVLSYNFDDNALQIYHNDNQMATLSLGNNKCIIPAVSLEKDIQLEILKCAFE